VERSFAHYYETGGMRRCHLRGRENILNRRVHVGAFNWSLILRKLLGAWVQFYLLPSRSLLICWTLFDAHAQLRGCKDDQYGDSVFVQRSKAQA